MNKKIDQKINVILHSGVHSGPLDLTEELDAGSPHFQVKYIGEPGAAITGAVRIPKTAFSSPNAQGIVTANLFSCCGINVSALGGGLANPYPQTLPELISGKKAQIIARHPNIDDSGTWQWVGFSNITNAANMSFDFADTQTAMLWERALSSSPEKELWVHGFFKFDWRDTFVKIKSIVKSNGAYTFTRDASTPPAYAFTDGFRMYALGSLDFLDAKGEYFIDAEGTLHYLPASPSCLDDMYLSVNASVITLPSYHTLENVDVFGSTSSLLQTASLQRRELVHDLFDDIDPYRAVASSTSNVLVKNCTLSAAASSCAALSGTNVSFEGNTVTGCGASGVFVTGGDVGKLLPSDNRVTGNTFEKFSRIRRTYTPGLAFGGVGLYAARNTITDAPHTGVQGGCVNCLFEHNALSELCYGTIDVGAFYVGRSWAQRGNVFRFSSIKNVRSKEKLAQQSCSQNGFYLDDQMSGWTFASNDVENCSQGVLLGGGRRNIIVNNTFRDNDVHVAFDNRGMNWEASSCNYNCSSSLGTSCFRVALEAVHYQSPPYSEAFPELVRIYDDQPCVPVYNSISNNAFCGSASALINRDAATIASWKSIAENNIRC